MGRKAQKLNLRELDNPSCRKCRNRDEKELQSDEGLCDTAVSVLDGLPVRCVGEWSRDKIYYLNQYLGIFASGMKNRWRGLNYIEIGSGPGRCVLSKTAREIDGTALSILNNPAQDHLKQALFIDLSDKVVKVLARRVAAIQSKVKCRVVQSNYKDADEMATLMQGLPPDHLNLVFIDPTQCDVPFATIKSVASMLKNADLIINVFMGVDVGRNIENAVSDPAYARTRRKYETFLGDTCFFQDPVVQKAAAEGRVKDLKQLFFDCYSRSLAGLGYGFIDVKQVRHYYWPVFASKSKTGLDFWKKACKYTPEDQQEFGF